MSEIWVISDTHFQHDNIIKFCNRPFVGAGQMDEHMIERWNSVVKPGDKVYHLGDVYFGSWYFADKILGRLNGKKRLIVGNHDDLKSKVLHNHFQKISMWRIFKEFGLLLTHVPVHPDNISSIGKKNDGTPYHELTNVHGHIHNNPSPEGRYKCVCVEQIDYTPVNIEELRTT